jgi:hypothetical protein
MNIYIYDWKAFYSRNGTDGSNWCGIIYTEGSLLVYSSLFGQNLKTDYLF